MKEHAALFIFRVVWNCSEDTTDLAERLISYARAYSEHALTDIQDINFVVSTITGVVTSSHGARQAQPQNRTILPRPGIAFIVCYSPTAKTSETTFIDIAHRIGMSSHSIDITTKEIDAKSKDPSIRILTQCCAAFKDVKLPYARQILDNSLEYTTEHYPGAPVCEDPAHVVLVNPAFSMLVVKLVERLKSLKMDITLSDRRESRDFQLFRPDAPKGVDRSMDIILRYLHERHLRIHSGHVYQKAEKAKFTFQRVASVESMLHKSQAEPFIAGNVSIAHLGALTKFLAHPDFSRAPQLKIDEDLIEINNERCWDLSKMEFVDVPLKDDQIGKLSPRAYFDWDEDTVPNPIPFINLVLNSFSVEEQRALFLAKWYQLMFYHRHQMKTPALMVVGPHDCGKTTMINPILELIPVEYIGSITKENQFSTSSINKDTRLTFVDEFEADRLTASQAKATLQGGVAVTSQKHKKVDIFYNRSQFFLTANVVPHWGADDINVKRRLEIFEMQRLPNIDPSVSQWLQDNAFECILWVGVTLRQLMHLVDKKELFFFYEPLPYSRKTVMVNRLDRTLQKPMPVLSKDNDGLLTLFNVPDEEVPDEEEGDATSTAYNDNDSTAANNSEDENDDDTTAANNSEGEIDENTSLRDIFDSASVSDASSVVGSLNVDVDFNKHDFDKNDIL